MVLAAASLSCPMEALLEAEQGVYPYFCPGIGVFIASSCCSDEHCRNTLWKVLPVCWSPSGLHMRVHTCMGVNTRTPPPGYPLPAPVSPHTAGKVSWGSDQGHHGGTGTASPHSPLRSRCGTGRNPKLRLVSVTNPVPQQAARARGCLIHPLSFSDCIRVPKNLPGEMLAA